MQEDPNKAKMNKLIQLISQANYAYHVLDNPLMNDAAYDSLFHQLKALEEQYPQYVQENSPTKKVGDRPKNIFQSVKHNYPMLSLGNVFSDDELRQFGSNLCKKLNVKMIDYDVQLKLDGLAVGIRYENGKLEIGRASCRERV